MTFRRGQRVRVVEGELAPLGLVGEVTHELGEMPYRPKVLGVRFLGIGLRMSPMTFFERELESITTKE